MRGESQIEFKHHLLTLVGLGHNTSSISEMTDTQAAAGGIDG
jgi:hypothetical protein